MSILNQLKESGIFAVVRNSTVDNIVPICESLVEGGINCIEITAETPNIAAIIEKAVNEVGDKILIGAGTVLDPETARSVISAGAQFIVSPTLNLETIKVTKRYGVVSIPGAFTPTEILTAYEHGADMIKVFPANVVGPSYVKNIHGPMPGIPIVLTGGINLDNLEEYVTSGAVGVGLGSNLVNPSKLNSEADYKALIEQARRYADAYKAAKAKI